MAQRLKDKVAIVTGAASGIGRASAKLFASEGAKVLASDVNEAGLADTVKAIRDAGGTAIGMVADVGNEAAVKSLVEHAVSELGGLHVMFANAGISGNWLPLADAGVAEFNEVLRINLVGPFLAIKYAAAHMRQQGAGSIICTASVAGLKANAGPIAYSASKAGVISLVQTCANSLYGTGVRVNAICPGLIETGMTKPIFDYVRGIGRESKLGQMNPLKRPAQPEEVAHAALFLASDDASYMNGHAMVVDGGLTSTMPFVPPQPVG